MSTVPTKQVDEITDGMKGQEGMTARLTAPMLTFNLVAEIEQLKVVVQSGDAKARL